MSLFLFTASGISAFVATVASMGAPSPFGKEGKFGKPHFVAFLFLLVALGAGVSGRFVDDSSAEIERDGLRKELDGATRERDGLKKKLDGATRERDGLKKKLDSIGEGLSALNANPDVEVSSVDISGPFETRNAGETTREASFQIDREVNSVVLLVQQRDVTPDEKVDHFIRVNGKKGPTLYKLGAKELHTAAYSIDRSVLRKGTNTITIEAVSRDSFQIGKAELILTYEPKKSKPDSH